MHVLGTPPAFVLSQDQTLRRESAPKKVRPKTSPSRNQSLKLFGRSLVGCEKPIRRLPDLFHGAHEPRLGPRYMSITSVKGSASPKAHSALQRGSTGLRSTHQAALHGRGVDRQAHCSVLKERALLRKLPNASRRRTLPACGQRKTPARRAPARHQATWVFYGSGAISTPLFSSGTPYDGVSIGAHANVQLARGPP